MHSAYKKQAFGEPRALKRQKDLKRRKKHDIARDEVLLVTEVANKVGVEVEEIFDYTPTAMRVPGWYKPRSQAKKFTDARAVVRGYRPEAEVHYRVPACVIAFARMLLSMATEKAKQFFDHLRAISAPAQALVAA